MSEKPIEKLESQLETLIEGAFARLFRKTLSARDIAVLIARSMEDNLLDAIGDDPRQIAPDIYHIYLNPDTVKQFLHSYPDLTRRLSELIVDLSTQSGFRLSNVPLIKLLADAQLAIHQFKVIATHGDESRNSTAAMQPMNVPNSKQVVNHPKLIVNEAHVYNLSSSYINIGRDESNDIVLDDAYISRHHLQIRKRFGAYTLFDVNSRGGTTVNNTPTREHRLQNGDVIRIGHTQIIYTDETHTHSQSGSTQILNPMD